MPKQERLEPDGPLAGHVRRGRTFVPEFAAKVEFTANDWFRDDMPDYLWPTLVAELQGNDALLRFVRWQGAVQGDLSDEIAAKDLAAGLDGRLTSLDRLAGLSEHAAPSVRARAAEFALLPDEVVDAMATYPERPAAWLIDKDLTEPEQRDVDLLCSALLGVLGDGHRESLVKCLQTWSAVQAGTFSADQSTIDLLKTYPNDEQRRSQADSAIRASWGAMKALATYENADAFDEAIRWARTFWGINSMTTACQRKRHEKDSSTDAQIEPPDAVLEPTSLDDVEDGANYRRYAMDLMSSYVEALETAPQRLYDQERQEVHAGLVSRAAREVITTLGAPDLWCLEHGSHVGRMLVETRIQLEWMATQDPTVYARYQDYGAGKAKLYARIMESFPDDWFCANEAMRDAVAEGVEEFDRLSHAHEVLDTRTVDLNSNFSAGKSLREMAVDVGLEDLYRNSFQIQSGIMHGEWWAIESHSMERCMNVLHRVHLIPSLSLSRGGDVLLAKTWLTGLQTLMRISLSVLGTKGESVAAAFAWLVDEDEAADPLAQPE